MQRELAVTPTSWSPRGEAVLSVRGRPIVVWQGIVGEHATVRITNLGRNRDYASFRGTQRPSPHRVDPPCEKYHTCGGCPLMHLDLAGQHAAKRAMVREALDAEGLGDLPVGELTAGPDAERDFRWVVKLGVGHSDHGRLRVGAWGRNNRSIVPIPHCLVAADPLRAVMASVAHHILELDLPPYDPASDRGVLRAVVLRGSRSTGEVLVTIIAGRRVRGLAELADRVAIEASPVVGVVLHLNADPGNAIFQRDPLGEIHTKVLRGRPYVEESLGGVRYRIGPGDFFQTNPGVAERLYARALDALDLGPDTPFVDLYSGVGGLALAAAARTGWAHGVEFLSGAVASARDAAKAQDLPATFECEDVGVLLPDLARRLAGARPVVAVNPARRGLEEGVAEGIAALRPRRIAYISCDPRAMARDLAHLRDLGFLPARVDPFDMFPHTAHVECLAILHSEDDEPPTGRAPRRRVIGATRESR